jgi:uncharacterized protein with ATP-grasp and redox domains
MKTYLECIPCFFQQALRASRLAGLSEGEQREVLLEVARRLPSFSLKSTPPEMGRAFYGLILRRAGRDPFAGIKARSNREALALYPALRKKIGSSPEPLLAAARLAIAGNVIDYGVNRSFDLRREVEAASSSARGIFQFREFRQNLERAERLLYLCDNAGEVVFDRLLIETLREEYPRLEITAVLRGEAVINDATLADARAAGLDRVCPVISNGSDAPGTLLSLCSRELRQNYQAADLVISKGQGNFESLWGEEKKIFFLFKVKCIVVARSVGEEVGQSVLLFSETES